MSHHDKSYYRLDGFVPLATYYKQLMSIVDEHEWEGQFDDADHYLQQAEDAKRRMEAGEVWEVPF